MQDRLLEYEGTWEELAVHAQNLVGHRLRLIVLDAGVSTEPASVTTLEVRLSDLASKVPAESWSKLPADLTDRLDEHLYGRFEP